MPDATIIGAGPAGSVAAVALARRGWCITLIEQHRLPRDKVCGESLSALGIDVLGRMNLLTRLAGLGPARLVRTALHAPDGRSVSILLPREMWGLSRQAMDFELLKAAKEAGARVLQPARCEAMGGELRVRHLEENRVETLKPTWVLLADGKGALMPRRPELTGDFGIKAHFEKVEGARDAVELFGARGHYVGLAPIEGELFNIAMSLPASRLERFGGDFDSMWEEMMGQNVSLQKRFAGAVRAGAWLVSPLPRFAVARRWPENVIPLGNAAAALEPIGGEGMGLALRSAELAAMALDEARHNGTLLPVKQLRARFNGLWRKRRMACRGVAKLLSNPSLAGPVIDWVAGSEALSREVLAWMGKGDA